MLKHIKKYFFIPDDELDIYENEIHSNNLRRITFLTILSLPVTLAHIILFLFAVDQQTVEQKEWRMGIILCHSALLVFFFIVGSILVFNKKYFTLSRKQTNYLIAVSYIFVIIIGTAITIFDQLVTSAITPFIVISVLISVSLVVKPIHSIIYFALAFLLLHFGIELTQHNPQISLSIKVNGLSAVMIGLFLSVMLWKLSIIKYKQSRLIEFQKSEIEKNYDALMITANQLETANATKDKFFSIVAHDLKNPFHILLGISKMLKDNLNSFTKEEIYAQLDAIYKTADHTHNLLDDLLAWARSQIGSIAFEPKEQNLNNVIDEVLTSVKSTADAKEIRITYYPKKDILVYADSNMLKTVLRNILSNAIKFTGRKGFVDIFAEHDDSSTSIIISDNGIGMDKETLNHVFDVTKVYSTPGTESEKGTGLGLILCKEFIEKHNGHLSVISEPGNGSKFKIVLPFKDTQSSLDSFNNTYPGFGITKPNLN